MSAGPSLVDEMARGIDVEIRTISGDIFNEDERRHIARAALAPVLARLTALADEWEPQVGGKAAARELRAFVREAGDEQ